MTASPYYEDDLLQLWVGDCRELTAWLDADVLVTDPPYGMSWKGGGDRINSVGVRSTSERRPVHGDETTEARDDVLALWAGRPALVFGTWKRPRPADVLERIIWHKGATVPALGTGTPWSGADEEVYVLGYGWPDAASAASAAGMRQQNVIRTDEYRAGSGGMAAQLGHPTPKPTDLMVQLIERCPPGVIADPFAGVGGTLLACRQLGRRCIAVELDEQHAATAVRRLAQGVLAV